MKKAVKKEKEVVKKAPKKAKKLEVVVNNDCPACKGIGLQRPDWVASPICPVCNGSGKQE